MKKTLTFELLALLVVGSLAASAQSPAYLDASQPLDKRVEDLISRLTLEEKASLLSTTAPAIERLKIPVMNGWNQSLHGIVWSRPTTMFPVPISMAATWNPELVKEVAAAIADEGRAIYNYWPTIKGRVQYTGGQGQMETITPDGKRYRHNGLIYRSPVVNMDRDPRWGRIWEAFGEDPLLVSRITVAYVQGTQSDDPRYLKLAATLKHFAVNNEEKDRQKLNARVSERTLREYFLPQFEAGIVDGKAQSIMSSYNALNGVPNAENKWLLTDILRGEWKFDGFVVPDSGAVQLLVAGHKKYKTVEEAVAKTILAGSDLDNGSYAPELPKTVTDGLLTERDVDQALRRVLKVRFRLGEFDAPEIVPYHKLGPEVIDSPAHRQLALRTAEESIVLLANRDNLLPLDKDKVKTIAVVGPFADFAQTGPNYTGLYSKFVKPLEGITSKVGSSVQVLYARGSGILESANTEASYAEAEAAAKRAEVVVLFLGINEMLEREGIDRNDVNLPPVQLQLLRRVSAANPKTIVVLQNGGPVSLASGGRPLERIAGVPTALDMFWAGEEGGTAIANVLFGDYNPGGKLPYTIYASTLGLPANDDYEISDGWTYMYCDVKPEYPFGHGLSYTSFQYSNMRISSNQIPANGRLTVNVDVQNSGHRAGDEVVELYVHDLQAKVKRPKEQLAGFERINLKPGEKKTVIFSVGPERLSYWDERAKQFVVEPSAFELMVGSSSEDIRARGQFRVTAAR